MNLDQKIEAFLFFKNEPVALLELARFFNVSGEEVKEALLSLENKLIGRGLQLVFQGEKVLLGTKKDFSIFLEKLQKEELDKELSRASLETLAIILYKNGATRGEIDYLRGVNSSFILRNLLIRGLIEKTISPIDQRKIIYQSTIDLISFLGLSQIEEIPDFSKVNEILNKELNG